VFWSNGLVGSITTLAILLLAGDRQGVRHCGTAVAAAKATGKYRRALDHLVTPQRSDFVRSKSELGKHLVGLLAEFRRPRRHFARRPRQGHRLADQTDVTVLGIRHVLRDAGPEEKSFVSTLFLMPIVAMFVGDH